jgi:hypothetical protein
MTLSPQTDKAVGLLAAMMGIFACLFALLICVLVIGCTVAWMVS